MTEKRAAPAAVIKALSRHFEVKSADMAELIDVERSAMSSKLNARREFKHEELYTLGQFFRVPLELFYGTRDDAIRFVLDHPETGPDRTVRSRCPLQMLAGGATQHGDGRPLVERRRHRESLKYDGMVYAERSARATSLAA